MHALLVLMLLAQSPVQADTLRPPEGPPVLWHREASPLVALRLSVPLPSNAPRGAAELVQELARPGATDRAAALGAALTIASTPATAVVSVVGPAAAFDGLAAILRRFTSIPDVSGASLRAARARAEQRVLGELERPEHRVRALLRTRLTGETPTGFAAGDLTADAVRRLGTQLHRPERLRVVVVGDVPPDVIRSAFSHWGDWRDVAPLPRPDSAPPPPTAEADRVWTGVAAPIPGTSATAAVAAALVDARLRAADLPAGSVEAWGWPGGPALAAVAALPESATLADLLRRGAMSVIAEVDAGAIAEVATGLRHQLLVAARTVSGRAEVVGRLVDDAGGAPADLDAYLASVDAVTPESVRQALSAMVADPPVTVDVRP